MSLEPIFWFYRRVESREWFMLKSFGPSASNFRLALGEVRIKEAPAFINLHVDVFNFAIALIIFFLLPRLSTLKHSFLRSLSVKARSIAPLIPFLLKGTLISFKNSRFDLTIHSWTSYLVQALILGLSLSKFRIVSSTISLFDELASSFKV